MAIRNDILTTRYRRIVRLTAALVAAGDLVLVGVAAAGTAEARPTWCPGDPRPAVAPWPGFDWSSCYEYSAPAGWIDVATGIYHPFPMDIPPTPPPPNPPECIGIFPLPGADPSHCVI